MKKALAGVFLWALFAAWGAYAAPAAPVFSENGGIYEADISLQLWGEGEIRYTTDGSVPTAESALYSEPIAIKGSSSNSAAATIRAVCISGGETSDVASATYFVNPNIHSQIGNVPMVNLIAEPYDLWDSSEGIYTNYNYEHKVPAVFHYISTNGTTEINRNVKIKVSGHGSRAERKKSLRVYFKKNDPAQGKYLNFNLIPESGVTKISKVTFRISDWTNTNLRDVLAQKIGSHTRAAIAASEPMALFLNGEYWGLYECREQYDADYLETHYGVDKDNIVYLNRDWTLEAQYSVFEETGTTYTDKIEYSEGPEDGNEEGRLGETYYRNCWTEVKSLVQEKDITSNEVYEKFCSMVDVDNYIDYVITYIYCANDDWPGNNFKFWRVTQENIDPSNPYADGKWRFMIHDFDIAFESVDHDTLYLSALQKDDDSAARHPAFATAMLGSLLKNETFRSEFAQRINVYFSDFLSSASVESIIDTMADKRRDAKAADLSRWSLGSVESWQKNINTMKTFAQKRPAKLKEQIVSILNKYYGQNTGNESMVSVSSDKDYYISGAHLTEDKTVSVFSDMPVRIEASGTKITATSKSGKIVGKNEISFVPGDEKWDVIIEDRPDCFAIYSVYKSEGKVLVDCSFESTYAGNAVLYVAAYSDDNTLINISKAVDFCANQTDGAAKYKAFIWDGVRPLCKSREI